jgi:uncharacterized protein (TIGR03067 family)
MKAMLLKKLRTVVTLFLVVTLLGSGGALLAHRALGAQKKSPPRDSKPSAKARDKADKKDKKAKSDKDLLQGTWIEQAGRKNKDGEEIPEEDRWTLVFEGDKVTWTIKGKKHEGTFTLDPDRKPKEIDLTLAKPRTLILNGIYEFKDGTLKTLWRENGRGSLPDKFDPKEGVLVVLKKKKK